MVVDTASRRARRRSDEDQLLHLRASLEASASVRLGWMPLLASVPVLRIGPMTAERARRGRTALYRFYDAAFGLLYVGISLQPAARQSQHRETAAWYEEIAYQTVQWFPTRALAERAESLAIESEGPMHNRRGRDHMAPDQGWKMHALRQIAKMPGYCGSYTFHDLLAYQLGIDAQSVASDCRRSGLCVPMHTTPVPYESAA